MTPETQKHPPGACIMDGTKCLWPECKKWLTPKIAGGTTPEIKPKESIINEKIQTAFILFLVSGWYALGLTTIAHALN